MREKAQKNKGTIRAFLHYFKPHKNLFILDMFCAALVSVIDLAFPMVTRWALNDLLPNKNYRAFFMLMFGVLLFFALRAFLYFVIAYWGHTFGIRVEADIRRDLFVHLEELDFGFFDQNRTGQLMSRLTSDLNEITELAHHGPEDLLISALTIFGALTVMFFVEWRLTLVVLVIMPIFITVTLSRRRKMSEASRGEKRKAAAINAGIESSLSGMKTARAFANEEIEIEKFDELNGQFKVSKRKFHMEMGFFNASLEFFMKLLPMAVITVGGYLIMNRNFQLADLIAFDLYVTTLVTPVRRLANFSEIFTRGFAGLERFKNLMDTKPQIVDASDAKMLDRAEGKIEVRDVCFAYDAAKREILHHVSFTVEPGETVALVGASGGGKSTLCQLVPRFYETHEGTILVDDLDVRSLTRKSLRRNIGIVQQDVFLFADTVRENIRYGKPDATDEEIIEAAKRAEIYDDIMEMPEGLDTYVGERGTLLSGGQKQRIAIARIFLKNPPILILDEATSALDSVTEAKIQHAFDELSRGRTTLIIAHRLSTIHAAKRIMVIEHGEIVESGEHEALLAQNGVYAELWNTQQRVR